MAFQFWFLRDLIILTIVSPAIFSINKIANYLLGFILAFVWLADIQLFPIVEGWYLINIETLFFFWVGEHIYRSQNILYAILESRNSVKAGFLFAWFSLIWIRIIIDPDLNVWYVRQYATGSLLLYKLAIVIGIVSLIQISKQFRHNKALIYLSGLTFFAYLFHLAPLSYFKLFTARAINHEFRFYANFPIATILVFLLAYIASSRFGPLYAVLTGGRSPNKALQR